MDTRRDFLLKGALALNGLVAVCAGIPIIGYLVGPLRHIGAQAWVRLGPVDTFAEGETRLATYENPLRVPWDGPAARTACWVRRVAGERFQVFAINCTHLGCPIRWFSQSQLFMCPCHGGMFYQDGSRASGPPPRGLFEYAYRVRDGALWVQVGEVPTLSRPV